MDEEIVKQMLDELFSSFADSETRSAGLLLFLKDQGIASDEKLAPYFEQAANTSEVRWRAARVRMGALLASALKTPELAGEKKTTKDQEKQESAANVEGEQADAKKAGNEKANGQTSKPQPKGSKGEAGSAHSSEDAAEDAQKSQDKSGEPTTAGRERTK